MPPTQGLPVELHAEILKELLDLSRHEIEVTEPWFVLDTGCCPEQKIMEWQWIEEDKGNPNQFPHNVYQVCPGWGTILSKIPECWTRLIFDVAIDPKDDIVKLQWSNDLPKLEITVFNSTSDHRDVDSEVERTRVSTIMDALRPHISRCKAIVFNVTYLTSLPSSAVFFQDAMYLAELTLDCKINNGGTLGNFRQDVEEYGLALESLSRHHPCPSLPRLSLLTIPGFWFMTIAGHRRTSQWLRKINLQKQDFNLVISHFAFESEGEYTMRNFASYCSYINPSTIVFRDLSLNYELNSIQSFTPPPEDFSIDGQTTFENDSPDFLFSIFSTMNITPHHIPMKFDGCSFPDKGFQIMVDNLRIMNVPDTPTGSRNLSNLLEQWRGRTSLEIESCPAFDDDLLSALAVSKQHIVRSLSIKHCNRFTPRGVQHYLESRNALDPHPDGRRIWSGSRRPKIHDLRVEGRCPTLTTEDRRWFRRTPCVQPMDIVWKDDGPQSRPFYLHFHPGYS